jgi:hypothetical protein
VCAEAEAASASKMPVFMVNLREGNAVKNFYNVVGLFIRAVARLRQISF